MLQAVGLVAAAAAQTESTLQQLIGGMLGIDNAQALAVTSQLSGLMRDFIARSLAEMDAPSVSEVDALDDLLDRVNKAMEKRHTLLHNPFAIHPTTGEIFSYRESARGSLQIKLTPVTASEINADAVDIYEAGMDVIRFMDSRGLESPYRTKPLREAVNRGKEARAKRRDPSV